MEKVEIGEKLRIQCYKHNGKVHAFWDEAVVLDVKENYIVCGNDKTLVTEDDGSTWKTKEPAIMYFFKDEWFNVIVQLKKTGIFYYCNIATPYIIEDDTIKYIDYDLDLRIYPSGEFKILDRMEYKYHKKVMKYSQKLDLVIRSSLSDLIEKYKNGYFVFNPIENKKYYNNYKLLSNK